MAANVAVTYTFTNGTTADASQVNQDFTDLVTWINTNAVHLDGSKAFTGAPSYAADPVSGNQLTRKTYVDNYIGGAEMKVVKLRRVAAQSIPNATLTDISWDTEDADASGFITAPGTSLTTPSGCGGLYEYHGTITWASAPTTPSATPATSPGGLLGVGVNSYGTNGTTTYFHGLLHLHAGSVFTFRVNHTTGSAVNVTCGITLKRLSD